MFRTIFALLSVFGWVNNAISAPTVRAGSIKTPTNIATKPSTNSAKTSSVATNNTQTTNADGDRIGSVRIWTKPSVSSGSSQKQDFSEITERIEQIQRELTALINAKTDSAETTELRDRIAELQNDLDDSIGDLTDLSEQLENKANKDEINQTNIDATTVYNAISDSINFRNFVNNVVNENPQIAGQIASINTALSSKADIADVSSKADQSAVTALENKLNNSDFVTSNEVESTVNKKLQAYYTGSDIDTKIAQAQLSGSNVDLSGYAKKSDLDDYAKTSVLDGYATTFDLNNKADAEDLRTLQGTVANIQTGTDVDAVNGLIEDQLRNFTPNININDIATQLKNDDTFKSELANSGAVADLLKNDDNFKRNLLSGYVTSSDLNDAISEIQPETDVDAVNGLIEDQLRNFTPNININDIATQLKNDDTFKSELADSEAVADLLKNDDNFKNNLLTGYAKTADVARDYAKTDDIKNITTLANEDATNGNDPISGTDVVWYLFGYNPTNRQSGWIKTNINVNNTTNENN